MIWLYAQKGKTGRKKKKERKKEKGELFKNSSRVLVSKFYRTLPEPIK